MTRLGELAAAANLSTAAWMISMSIIARSRTNCPRQFTG
jgi:hypothetical protein